MKKTLFILNLFILVFCKNIICGDFGGGMPMCSVNGGGGCYSSSGGCYGSSDFCSPSYLGSGNSNASCASLSYCSPLSQGTNVASSLCPLASLPDCSALVPLEFPNCPSFDRGNLLLCQSSQVSVANILCSLNSTPDHSAIVPLKIPDSSSINSMSILPESLQNLGPRAKENCMEYTDEQGNKSELCFNPKEECKISMAHVIKHTVMKSLLHGGYEMIKNGKPSRESVIRAIGKVFISAPKNFKVSQAMENIKYSLCLYKQLAIKGKIDYQDHVKANTLNYLVKEMTKNAQEKAEHKAEIKVQQAIVHAFNKKCEVLSQSNVSVLQTQRETMNTEKTVSSVIQEVSSKQNTTYDLHETAKVACDIARVQSTGPYAVSHDDSQILETFVAQSYTQQILSIIEEIKQLTNKVQS